MQYDYRNLIKKKLEQRYVVDDFTLDLDIVLKNITFKICIQFYIKEIILY